MLTPADFTSRALAYPGIHSETIEIGERRVIALSRLHGDSLLRANLVDVPVRMPVSHVIAICRDLDLPISDFSVVLQDL